MSNFLQKTPTEIFILAGLIVVVLAVGISILAWTFGGGGETTALASTRPTEPDSVTRSSISESTEMSTTSLESTTRKVDLETDLAAPKLVEATSKIEPESSEKAPSDPASIKQLVNSFGDIGVGNVQTKVKIDPPGGTVGTAVAVIITVSNSFDNSRIRDISVEATREGSIEFFPDTFQPAPATSPLTADAVPGLVWSGLELAPNAKLEIRGKGRITGPRSFKVLANSKGKREISVGSDAQDQGAGSGRGVTSSIRDDQDALVVGESFNYIITIEGQADTPEPFEVTVNLPEQVAAEDVQVASKEALAVGVCKIDVAAQSVICTESKVKKGGTLTITARVRASVAGLSSSANAAKARLVVKYPETGLEVSSEEVTFIYQ